MLIEYSSTNGRSWLSVYPARTCATVAQPRALHDTDLASWSEPTGLDAGTELRHARPAARVGECALRQGPPCLCLLGGGVLLVEG